MNSEIRALLKKVASTVVFSALNAVVFTYVSDRIRGYMKKDSNKEENNS